MPTTSVYCVSICFECKITQLLQRRMDNCECNLVYDNAEDDKEKCDRCNKKLLFIKICYKCTSLQIEDQEMLLKQSSKSNQEKKKGTDNFVTETVKYSLQDIVID